MTRVPAIVSLIALVGIAGGCAHRAPAPTEDAHTLVEKGRLAAKKGDYQGAVALYTRAVTKDPELAEAYNERGKTNVQLRLAPGDGDRDVRLYEQNALDDFSMAVDKNSSYADAYYNRAMVLASRAQYKQAVDDLLNAAKYNPKDPEPHRWLGVIYDDKFEDRSKLAMEHYVQYVDLGGTDPAIQEKVRAWKEARKAITLPPAASLKPATPEDEQKAEELHARAVKLMGQPDPTECIQLLQTLVTTYGNTRYVQKMLPALRVILAQLERQKGLPK